MEQWYSIVQPITRNHLLTKKILEEITSSCKNKPIEDQIRIVINVAIESVYERRKNR